MSGVDDIPGVDVKVDTFINYKDESLMQRSEVSYGSDVAAQVSQHVMRVMEEQTIEALQLLGWFAPGTIPDFSEAAVDAAQQTYNVTPVLFGDRHRRMRIALIAAMQVHAVEVRAGVQARAAELEAKFGPKPAPEVETMTLLVSMSGDWITDVDGGDDVEVWLRTHDDVRRITVPLGYDDDLCEVVSKMACNGASNEEIDLHIRFWYEAPRG